MNSSTLSEIISQIESCGYTCEAGPIERNTAWIALKAMAEENKSFEGLRSQRTIYWIGKPILTISNHPKGGWFRLFGVGLKWKHESERLTFSQRNGIEKTVKIGKYIFGYLNTL